MKKLISVVVILLFIGLAFAPSINANAQSDFVEFTTEVSGLNRRKQTVKLTQGEVEEIDALFCLIGDQLNATNTKEEARTILNKAIMQLDKYGLLGGLSARKIENLFKSYNETQIKIDTKNVLTNENANCIIVGKVNHSFFINPIIYSLIRYIENNGAQEFDLLLNLLFLMALFFDIPLFPFKVDASIALGRYYQFLYHTSSYPSQGWITTMGSNGHKSWYGELKGTIDCIDISVFSKNLFYIGVEGFSGLKIHNPLTGKDYLLGYAKKVKIDAGWLDNVKHRLLFASVIFIGKSLLFRSRKLFEIICSHHFPELLNFILDLRSIWLIIKLEFWIKFWNDISDKYNWKWGDIFYKIYG